MDRSFGIICITNRHLAVRDYRETLIDIAKAHPHAVFLREKDLSADEYRELAKWYIDVCRECGTKVFMHYYHEDAKQLNPDGLHMPLNRLEEILSGYGIRAEDGSPANRKRLREILGAAEIGVSCHSISDAKTAESLGCTYIIAGHVFDTDCKKGTPGRGTGFLKEVVNSVKIPVYAIGGITPDNIRDVKACGASGACIMSSAMENADVTGLLERFLAECF